MFRINDDDSMVIIRGDSGGFTFVIYEEDDEGHETPYILEEEDTLTFTVKKTTKDEESLIHIEGSKLDESTFIFEINPEDTSNLNYGVYKYDIEFRRFDGYVDTLVPPTKFKIADEVTF